MRGAQAVGVVYLSRFIWIPKRSNTSINLSIIGTAASLSSPKKKGVLSSKHRAGEECSSEH